MPRESPYAIELSKHERAKLETLARRYTSPYRDVLRAKIILYAAQGLPNNLIAARLDTPRKIVSKWRKRFFESRLPGLDERCVLMIKTRRRVLGQNRIDETLAQVLLHAREQRLRFAHLRSRS